MAYQRLLTILYSSSGAFNSFVSPTGTQQGRNLAPGRLTGSPSLDGEPGGRAAHQPRKRAAHSGRVGSPRSKAGLLWLPSILPAPPWRPLRLSAAPSPFLALTVEWQQIRMQPWVRARSKEAPQTPRRQTAAAQWLHVAACCCRVACSLDDETTTAAALLVRYNTRSVPFDRVSVL